MSFELILPDVLLTIPFFIGWQRPTYDSNVTIRNALMRKDIYQEQVEERVEVEKYVEESRKEDKKGLFASFVGSLIGATIGFFTGGPTGAKIGWNAGKVFGKNIRRQESDYFDGLEFLSGNKVLKGGQFNRAADRGRWIDMVNQAEDIKDTEKLTDMFDIGKAVWLGFSEDWSKFDRKAWKDLTFSGKFRELIDSYKVNHLEDFLNAQEDAGKDIVSDVYEGPSIADSSHWVQKTAERFGLPFEAQRHTPFSLNISDVEKELDKEIDKFIKDISNNPENFIPQLKSPTTQITTVHPDPPPRRDPLMTIPTYTTGQTSFPPEDRNIISSLSGQDRKQLIDWSKFSFIRNFFNPEWREQNQARWRDWFSSMKTELPAIIDKDEQPVMEIPDFGGGYNFGQPIVGDGIANQNLVYEGPSMSTYMQRQEEGKFLWKDWWQNREGLFNPISAKDPDIDYDPGYLTGMGESIPVIKPITPILPVEDIPDIDASLDALQANPTNNLSESQRIKDIAASQGLDHDFYVPFGNEGFFFNVGEYYESQGGLEGDVSSWWNPDIQSNIQRSIDYYVENPNVSDGPDDVPSNIWNWVLNRIEQSSFSIMEGE